MMTTITTAASALPASAPALPAVAGANPAPAMPGLPLPSMPVAPGAAAIVLPLFAQFLGLVDLLGTVAAPADSESESESEQQVGDGAAATATAPDAGAALAAAPVAPAPDGNVLAAMTATFMAPPVKLPGTVSPAAPAPQTAPNPGTAANAAPVAAIDNGAAAHANPALTITLNPTAMAFNAQAALLPVRPAGSGRSDASTGAAASSSNTSAATAAFTAGPKLDATSASAAVTDAGTGTGTGTGAKSDSGSGDSKSGSVKPDTGSKLDFATGAAAIAPPAFATGGAEVAPQAAARQRLFDSLVQQTGLMQGARPMLASGIGMDAERPAPVAAAPAVASANTVSPANWNMAAPVGMADTPVVSGAAVKLAGPASQWQETLKDALGERLQVQLARNSEHAVIRLDPPLLGRIDISIKHAAGTLQVNLSASNSDVLRQLQNIGDSMRQDLSQQRQFSDVTVSVMPTPRSAAAQAFGDGAGDGRQRQPGRQQDDADPGRALSDAGAPASTFALNDRE